MVEQMATTCDICREEVEKSVKVMAKVIFYSEIKCDGD